MNPAFPFDPKTDFAIERVIDAPTRLVWEALTKPEHLQAWYMPKAWGRVSNAELDLRPGGIIRIDIAVGDGPDIPNLGCVLEVVPMQRLVWTSMLFPGYRPAVFDDIPITAIIAAKYFRHERRTLPVLLLSVILWSMVLSTAWSFVR